jgi:ribosome recycling factor
MRRRRDGLIFRESESAPVVVVFTKYDLLVRTKKAELKLQERSEDLDELSKEEAQKALDSYVQSLEHAMESVEAPTPPHVKVSSIISHFFYAQC